MGRPPAEAVAYPYSPGGPRDPNEPIGGRSALPAAAALRPAPDVVSMCTAGVRWPAAEGRSAEGHNAAAKGKPGAAPGGCVGGGLNAAGSATEACVALGGETPRLSRKREEGERQGGPRAAPARGAFRRACC